MLNDLPCSSHSFCSLTKSINCHFQRNNRTREVNCPVFVFEGHSVGRLSQFPGPQKPQRKAHQKVKAQEGPWLPAPLPHGARTAFLANSTPQWLLCAPAPRRFHRTCSSHTAGAQGQGRRGSSGKAVWFTHFQQSPGPSNQS